jgi:DNA-3-methyladenine glycosylase
MHGRAMKRLKQQLIPRSFFSRRTDLVARDLLGCLLVRQSNGTRLSGRIVEVEAYIGEEDLACHAKAGRTRRTEVMYGPAGFAYVYFTYGMHWMLNVVTEEEGFPAAVLIRAVEPVEGIELMRGWRGMEEKTLLCRGPARLTQAMNIRQPENGLDFCQTGSPLWIEAGAKANTDEIAISPRIGLGNTPEPWLSKPWRFYLKDSPFVSKVAKTRSAADGFFGEGG